MMGFANSHQSPLIVFFHFQRAGHKDHLYNPPGLFHPDNTLELLYLQGFSPNRDLDLLPESNPPMLFYESRLLHPHPRAAAKVYSLYRSASKFKCCHSHPVAIPSWLFPSLRLSLSLQLKTASRLLPLTYFR